MPPKLTSKERKALRKQQEKDRKEAEKAQKKADRAAEKARKEAEAEEARQKAEEEADQEAAAAAEAGTSTAKEDSKRMPPPAIPQLGLKGTLMNATQAAGYVRQCTRSTAILIDDFKQGNVDPEIYADYLHVLKGQVVLIDPSMKHADVNAVAAAVADPEGDSIRDKTTFQDPNYIQREQVQISQLVQQPGQPDYKPETRGTKVFTPMTEEEWQAMAPKVDREEYEDDELEGMVEDLFIQCEKRDDANAQITKVLHQLVGRLPLAEYFQLMNMACRAPMAIQLDDGFYHRISMGQGVELPAGVKERPVTRAQLDQAAGRLAAATPMTAAEKRRAAQVPEITKPKWDRPGGRLVTALEKIVPNPTSPHLTAEGVREETRLLALMAYVFVCRYFDQNVRNPYLAPVEGTARLFTGTKKYHRPRLVTDGKRFQSGSKKEAEPLPPEPQESDEEKMEHERRRLRMARRQKNRLPGSTDTVKRKLDRKDDDDDDDNIGGAKRPRTSDPVSQASTSSTITSETVGEVTTTGDEPSESGEQDPALELIEAAIQDTSGSSQRARGSRRLSPRFSRPVIQDQDAEDPLYQPTRSDLDTTWETEDTADTSMQLTDDSLADELAAKAARRKATAAKKTAAAATTGMRTKPSPVPALADYPKTSTGRPALTVDQLVVQMFAGDDRKQLMVKEMLRMKTLDPTSMTAEERTLAIRLPLYKKDAEQALADQLWESGREGQSESEAEPTPKKKATRRK